MTRIVAPEEEANPRLLQACVRKRFSGATAMAAHGREDESLLACKSDKRIFNSYGDALHFSADEITQALAAWVVCHGAGCARENARSLLQPDSVPACTKPCAETGFGHGRMPAPGKPKN